MPVGSTSYNEFNPEQRAEIDALAQALAHRQKGWLDREMKKFRDARTLVLIGRGIQYLTGTGELLAAVDMEGHNLTVHLHGVNAKDGKAAEGHAIRILYDTKTRVPYYDDLYV